MNKTEFESALKSMEIEFEASYYDDFDVYRQLLVEWNEHMNLTGITEKRQVFIKHFLDSIGTFLSKAVPEGGKVIDVGTGAGFPGLAMKMFDRSISLTLLDSLNKRINFLRAVCEKTQLDDVELIHGRAEDFGKDALYREQFDVSVSRAVANLAVLTEYCIPFVKVGGYFIALKSKSYNEELEEAKKAIEVLGGQVQGVIPVKLPDTDIEHTLILIKKVKSTPDKYPRKAGKPTKSPII
jgi:16S rRNA (guanine527-N7)-methyltransferase